METYNIFTLLIKDLVLFSFLEAILYCIYVKNKFNTKALSFNTLIIAFVMGIINSTMYFLIPPILFQICLVFVDGLFLSFALNKNVYSCIFHMLEIMIITLIIETIFIFNIFEYDLFVIGNAFISFVDMIPHILIKIIEFLFVINLRKMGGALNMKGWYGVIKK